MNEESDKLVLLYGNCQIVICVYEYIKYFYKNIILWKSYNLIENNQPINYDILQNADIFIYQPINDSFGIYSIKDMNKYLKENCIKIIVPFIFLNSFFPLTNKAVAVTLDGVIDKREDKYKNMILNQDIIIELNKKYSREEIIELYKNDQIDFNYQKMFEENISRMKEKEKECNIKVVDFILDNYKYYQLVKNHLHPNGILIYHYVKQIFKILNLGIPKYIDNPIGDPPEMYLYTQSSINFFGFEFNIEKDQIRTDNHYIDLINKIIDNL